MNIKVESKRGEPKSTTEKDREREREKSHEMKPKIDRQQQLKHSRF